MVLFTASSNVSWIVLAAYLNSAPALLLQENILRLHVTVNDLVSEEKVQTLEQGMSKLSDQLQTEPLELVLLDQLVEVDAEQLEGDAGVGPEGEVVEQVDDVVGVVLVLLPQVLQDPYLLLGLPVEPLLVPDHLQRHVVVVLVVVGLDHLAEAALSNHFEHLVPVGQMVVGDVSVGALVVVVPAVVGGGDDPRPLLGVGTDEVDLGVVEDLVVLVRGQFVHV